jgi:hypothetical protein
MSRLPAAYYDEYAQYFGEENMESTKQESKGLLALEALSRYDVSDWSSLDDALYANCPLVLMPETKPDSEVPGKLLIR